MNKFRWYDWVVIFMIADMLSASIIAVMMGAFQVVFIPPLIMLLWMSYEDFRARVENEKNSK
jgi:hypothetical protein